MKNFLIKRMAIAAIAAMMCVSAANAQPFVKGENIVSASVGFGGIYTGNLYSTGKSTPVWSLYYEHCLFDNLWDEKSSIGIGGMFSHTAYKYGGADDRKVSNNYIGARGVLHYAPVNKLDVYAGFTMGYDIVSWKNSAVELADEDSYFDFGFIAGARYYFTDSFGVFAESGVGRSLFNAGVTLKF